MKTKSLRTQVVNLRGVPAAEREEFCAREDVERIDRMTVWGNPFRYGSREHKIARYRIYLWWTIQHNPQVMYDLIELRGKKLACWCHPKPCHGDVIAKAIEWAVKEVEERPYLRETVLWSRKKS